MKWTLCEFSIIQPDLAFWHPWVRLSLALLCPQIHARSAVLHNSDDPHALFPRLKRPLQWCGSKKALEYSSQRPLRCLRACPGPEAETTGPLERVNRTVIIRSTRWPGLANGGNIESFTPWAKHPMFAESIYAMIYSFPDPLEDGPTYSRNHPGSEPALETGHPTWALMLALRSPGYQCR